MKNQEEIIKSKKRVNQHGEVFTPLEIVNDMLDTVQSESERIDSRFLEPACGNGNFLVQVLNRKFQTVQLKYKASIFEKKHYALLAIMSVYGIELLKDNIEECKMNLANSFAEFLKINKSDDIFKAAIRVLSLNLIQGNALTMKKKDGTSIFFSEWGYLGKGKFQRRDFLLETLSLSAEFKKEDSLFSTLNNEDIFRPIRSFKPMSIEEISENQIHQI